MSTGDVRVPVGEAEVDVGAPVLGEIDVLVGDEGTSDNIRAMEDGVDLDPSAPGERFCLPAPCRNGLTLDLETKTTSKGNDEVEHRINH